MNKYPENSALQIATDVSVGNSQNDTLSHKQQLSEPNNNNNSWWQRLGQTWNNIPIQGKITTLLIICTTIPIIAVTQGIVEFAKRDALKELQNTLTLDLTLLEQKISEQKRDLEINAHSLALSVQAADIDLENSNAVAANTEKLQSFIASVRAKQPNASFYIITNGQGKTVAQSVQVVKDEATQYPLLPTEKNTATEFQPVNLKASINLGDIPIINNALKLSRSLSGVELLSSDILKRIGLDKQADIGVRYQDTQGLSEAKKPFPEGTFDVDKGRVGLVLMAVEPIKLSNDEVGTAIVGTLINRNFELVDRLKKETGVSTATIFARDWRVSTNVPYTDNQTRAIGTRVSQAVADAVLNRKEVFLGDANIIGIEYVTGYSPIYNHLQQINGEQAQPVGIAYVGEPKTQVRQMLGRITLIGYGVGIVALIIILAIVIVVNPSDRFISRPLRRLTELATEIASGKSGVRMETANRQDEIGILTRNLNEMAKNIEENLEIRQIEAEKQRQQREALEREIFLLLEEVGEATEGDLTVRASLSSLEISTIADLFNAIIDSLQEIALEVKQSSGQVSSSLQDNEAAIRLLSEQAIKEAEGTRNTLSSVEAMSQSIQEVASNAGQAANIADDTYSTVRESTSAMANTVDSIASLRHTVGETAKKMKRLGESSQKISQVVSLIEEIALKTNLLAINASVEASRAGEQGQGFSVVAEQVGMLAEQSAAATKEIAQIVASIQIETQEVTQAMEAGTEQVVDTTRSIESTKESLGLVLQKSQEINQLMRSISQATVSQANASQTIAGLMQQMTQMSEQSLLSSKKVARSMLETAQVAQKLESTVAKFKVTAD
jgi:methyl-accepting chemotaxis protein